jgi:hypothetical protein
MLVFFVNVILTLLSAGHYCLAFTLLAILFAPRCFWTGLFSLPALIFGFWKPAQTRAILLAFSVTAANTHFNFHFERAGDLQLSPGHGEFDKVSPLLTTQTSPCSRCGCN